MIIYKPKDGNIYTLPKALFEGEVIVGSELYLNKNHNKLNTSGEEKDFCGYVTKVLEDSYVIIYKSNN